MLKNLSEEKLPTVLLKFNSELLLKRNGFEPKTHLKSKGIIEIRPQVMSQTKETIAKTKQKTKILHPVQLSIKTEPEVKFWISRF